MTTPDLINGLFEAYGSIAVWTNVHALYRDKMVKGYRLSASLFFTSWGMWNMFYYPHLGQWLSTTGGASLCVANIVWFCMSVYYHRRQRG